jgi:hypothetical protein
MVLLMTLLKYAQQDAEPQNKNLLPSHILVSWLRFVQGELSPEH